VVDLEELNKELVNIQEHLKEVEGKFKEVSLEIVADFLQKPRITLYNIEIGNRDCKNSPIGVCFYEDNNLEHWNICLICGRPMDRLS